MERRAVFFFFQAEDGIRDLYVTGVQTCALPISIRRAVPRPVVQVDEGVTGPRKHGGEPAPCELGAQQLPDREGDVLLGQRAGEVAARVAGVAAAVAGIDDNRVTQP